MKTILQLLALSALALAVWAMPVSASTIEPHHSALWYDPARDGEGFVLEVYADDHALLTWYTYDDAGKQRWLTGFGSVTVDDDGNEQLHFPEMLAPRGGRFGPGFDPAQVQRVPVGEITLRFDDCWRGEVDYAVFGQTGTIDLHRLTRTMGATCGPIHGTTGEPVQPYAGQSGAWYDPAHDGEGWLLQWLAEGEAIVTWFTYTPQGEPYWLIGTGTMEDGRIVFPQLQTTRGARFGDAFDPDDVERIDWGSLELAIDCDAGTMRYESTIAGFGQGGLDGLLHLSRLAQPPCPWVAPKFTDLYDISLTRLNTEQANPLDSGMTVRRIADDGTVLASGQSAAGSGIHLRAADGGPWQYLHDADRIEADSAFMSNDVSSIVSNRWREQPPRVPVLWHQTHHEWRPLEGFQPTSRGNLLTAASSNHRWLAGRLLRDDGSERPFLWSREQGQTLLPLTDTIRSGYPLTVSDDGRIVYGVDVRFPHGNHFARSIAVRWVDGQAPESLTDLDGVDLGTISAMSYDGGVVFGFDQVAIDDSHPNTRQAWYWIAPGRMAYLGSIDGTWLDNPAPAGVGAVTRDGSLGVGSYRRGEFEPEGLIWSQNTGLVSLRDVLTETGLLAQLEADGSWTERYAVAISSTGERILLSGVTRVGLGGGNSIPRGAILQLTPKASVEPK